MKRWRALAVMVTVGISLGGVADGTDADRLYSSLENLQQRVVVLTDPSLAGRASGTVEADAAAETLAVWLQEFGLEPAWDGAWFQEVPLTGLGWSGEELEGQSGRNVAGILPGSGHLAGRYVVVGAHYDHLGRVVPVEGRARSPEPGQYYPGANDNASGVAVVCELAELAVADRDLAPDRRSVLFAFFVAEEVGLQGSSYMVSHLPVASDSVDAMVNFDTVGQLTAGSLYVSGVGTSGPLAALVDSARGPELELSLAQGGWSGSDHMSFNTRQVPVLFLFGGSYRQYNRPTDDWSTLDYEALARVAAYSDRLLNLIRCEPGDFDWVMVAEKNLRPATGDDQNRDTWFGSLPDFTEDVVGYPLAGVFDGSPAAQAGLQKGDVLVRFGGTPIQDLSTFTQALRSYSPGDLVEVQVEREGRRLQFTVVLGNRADRK